MQIGGDCERMPVTRIAQAFKGHERSRKALL